jgi:hypothetical protein
MMGLSGCHTVKHVSKFSDKPVELGIKKQAFIAKYGKPYNQETSYNDRRELKEILLYKEELYLTSWYIITTAFSFENSKLVKQEVIKEERKFQNCECTGND